MFNATDWITASSSFVLMLVTGAYVWISWKMFASRLDPHVILTTVYDNRHQTCIMLVVKNIGSGLAEEVKFEFSRPIPQEAFSSSPDNAQDIQAMSYGPLINGIACLAPGDERRIIWGQYGALADYLGDTPVEAICHFKRQGKTMTPVRCLLETKSFEGCDGMEAPEVTLNKRLELLATKIDKIRL